MWKKSGLSLAFSGRNSDVPHKNFTGGHLSLRDYEAQVGEAMAMVKALNRMTFLGMRHSVRIG